ncbi:hypothetical protein QYE76_011633 [Lolium multiflorum]|uniref:Uncharacterized protein n=1 Tax=Lolium multiflorum TaxID=4521 RepID=A0AAD8X366_LOLMU|nr:hypothetical protein QYE76_011633 [Lolium multiflorum]
MAFHRLLLLLLLAMVPLLTTSACKLPPEHTTEPRRHHPPPPSTLTARFHPVPSATTSMRQNHAVPCATTSTATLTLDRFTTQAPPSPREQAMAGAPLGPPKPAATPPPPIAAPDLTSEPPTRQQEDTGSEGSASAPTVAEPAAATTFLDQRAAAASAAAGSPPPIQAGLARAVPLGSQEGLLPLARALTSVGYTEMASAAPLLTWWSGAITVFAAPDGSSCPHRDNLVEHIALGYYPYSELAASRTVKIPSASLNLCLNIVTVRGTFSRLYVEGVEISHPDLYNDGRYIIHGLHGWLPPLRDSCFEAARVSSNSSGPDGARCGGRNATRATGAIDDDSHHPRRSLAVAGRSPAAAPMREAIARLRRRGYGDLAIALRVKFPHLRKFTNVTAFAFDDQAIFGGGVDDNSQARRLYIVPNYRLTHADLLRLRPGTVFYTLAGGQSLVVTHGAGSQVRINGMSIKDPDVAVNSRIAVHGMRSGPPHLNMAAAQGQRKIVSKRSPVQMTRDSVVSSGVPLYWAVSAVLLAAVAGAVVAGSWFAWRSGNNGQRIYLAQEAMDAVYRARYGRRNLLAEIDEQTQRNCIICSISPFHWRATCCKRKYCSSCVGAGYVKHHNAFYAPNPCIEDGILVPTLRVILHPDFVGMYMESEERVKSEFEKELQQYGPMDEHIVKRIYSSHEDLTAKVPPRRILVYSRVTTGQIIHQSIYETTRIA